MTPPVSPSPPLPLSQKIVKKHVTNDELNKGGEQEKLPLTQDKEQDLSSLTQEQEQNLTPLKKGGHRSEGEEGSAADDSPEQMELLLSGLVVKRDGKLTVRNPIYAAVFNQDWVDEQLENLRPYAKMLTAWLDSNCTDASRLLRGQALREALDWAAFRSLSNQDYQFLAASQELDKREIQLILEAQRTKEVEARLEQEKRATRLQQMLLGAVITALQESQLSEIEAIATSSEALFITEQRLDALIAAIKAKRKLQQLAMANPELEKRVQLLLEQAVYGASEFNRLSGHQATLYRLAISPDAQTIAFRGRQAPQKPDVQSTLGFKPSQKTSDLLTTGSS